MAEEATYYYGTGRRKTAVARVRLYSGDGTITINGKPADALFGTERLKGIVLRPLQVTDNLGKFSIAAKTAGGGISGQAAAVSHGVSRALLKADENLRQALRSCGLLTRDPRAKERKKYGLKRARKRRQYRKR